MEDKCTKCGRDNMDDMLREKLGMTPEWEIANIKETAMNRYSVKKGRRSHIRRILDEAFEILQRR